MEEGGEEGLYLIRESCSCPGNYVLSVIVNRVPTHHLVSRHFNDTFFYLTMGTTNEMFSGLDSLVKHFKLHPLIPSMGLTLGRRCSGSPPPLHILSQGHSNLLHRAVSKENLKIVGELLKSGYNKLDMRNEEGQCALHLACFKGNEEIVSMMLEAKASTHVRDQEGLTPLHIACRYNHPKIVKMLIEKGEADVQARSAVNECVSMHEAAANGSSTCIEELLRNGAPVYPRDKDNNTPIDLATYNGHTYCVNILNNSRPMRPEHKLEEYYYNTLSRGMAEKLLLDYGQPQCCVFLVRKSQKTNQSYILSLVHRHQVYHFQILEENNFLFIDDGPYFTHIEFLIDHYSIFEDGLPCRLTHPLPKNEHNEGYRLPFDYLPSEECYKSINANSSDDTLSEPSNEATLSSLNGNKTNEILGDIKHQHLAVGSTLGLGEFGTVYKGLWTVSTGDQITVAIKTLKENSEVDRAQFFREVNIMMNLNHPYIIKLLGVCREPALAMVQELATMGSLLDFVLNNPDELKPEQHFQMWAGQVAEGMAYLEEKHFVHRDLAARNLLLSSLSIVKISDFGLSRALDVNRDYYKVSHGGRWPLKWYAPESIYYGNFTSKSDVWSYGVTLWEIYTFGEQPYGELPGVEVMQLLEKNERLPQPEHCSKDIYNLMLDCWHFEPTKRPAFHQIKELFNSVF